MMSGLERMNSARESELPLSEASPNLRRIIDVWQDKADQAGWIPRELDVLEVPTAVLPYVMLLDLDDVNQRLVVRLAGTEVCAKYGGELRGKTTHDFFRPTDAEIVFESARRVALDARPSLAQRDYVNIDNRRWRYTRLILPLSRNGNRVDSFFKTLDPATLNW